MHFSWKEHPAGQWDVRRSSQTGKKTLASVYEIIKESLGTSLGHQESSSREFVLSETNDQAFRPVLSREIVNIVPSLKNCAKKNSKEFALSEANDQPLCPDLSRDIVDIVDVLKNCAEQKDLHRGTIIHADILKRGLLDKDCYVASTLVHMYAQCGAVAKAAGVLDELLIRDVVSWSVLIAGYMEYGQTDIAFKCFEQMQHEGLSPDRVAYIILLKACGSMCSSNKGKQVHDDIVQKDLLKKDITLGNSLVDMYTKCGELDKAVEVLNQLSLRNAVSWNTLIAGHVQEGNFDKAFKCFDQMQSESLSPDAVTFICISKACSSIKAVNKCEWIYNEVVRHGLLGADGVLGTALVDMYAKCGVLSKAVELLDQLPVRDEVSWSSLIAGYVHQGCDEEAFCCFKRMQNEGLLPDTVTFTYVLKICGSIRAVNEGKRIHEEVVRQGLVGQDIVLGTTIVDMYAKCGLVGKAVQVHNNLFAKNVISWNALIMGHVHQGHGEEALQCFVQMQQEGLSPDIASYVCLLKACGITGASDKGKYIHDKLVLEGFLLKDSLIGNTLVDMYVKFGALEKAAKVLEELPVRDAVTWSTLIAGYAEQGQGKEALKCYKEMKRDGLSPNIITFVCILKACGSIGEIDIGKGLYQEIVTQEWLEKNIVLGTAVVCMFAKCGELSKASQVLDMLPLRNVVTWNALIAGYAQQCLGNEAVKCFEWMQNEGFSPDIVTLTSVLNSCSRSGLLLKGQIIFSNINTMYRITPDMMHHGCMADLYCRAGEFLKALEVMNKMPCCDHLPIWHAFLGACRGSGNVKLGRLAFDNAIRIDAYDAATEALMAKICAADSMQENSV